MRDNPVQFAVVREDPALEASLLAEMPEAERVLLIASGGCSALTLAGQFPHLELTLVDPNPAQLALVERKARALREVQRTDDEARWRRTFNVGDPDPAGLNASGNFESLFRGLFALVGDLVLPLEETKARFLDAGARGAPFPGLGDVVEHQFWRAAFALFWADPLLHAMFGPDATQHAVPGSYPGYFREVFERGLARADAGRNPWLHHAMLGCYLDDAIPGWILGPPPRPGQLELVEGKLDAVPDLGRFGLVQLSNIFDWMSREEGDALLARAALEMRAGARLVIRQLNATSDLAVRLGDAFVVDEERCARWAVEDRSLFYNRYVVATHR